MSKKYKVIAKVETEKFVKYNVNNLLLFTSFLDKNFPNWRWFNVYEYRKDDSGTQLANFTKNNRPSRMYV
jgi:hypothetical protein